ncbi:MAG: hypothetical protein C4527_19060 [Candidatus Omnitrophota bacterium]|jgi:hypothetical protein|nr:MAG: hypothetical protein C4527_19060 [Candidatus Omnitrophota bacterium]
MNYCRIGWFGFLFVTVAHFSIGASAQYKYPPSEHPNFTLIESGESYAAIRYLSPGGLSLTRSTDVIYVGVPVGATYELKYRSWEYGMYSQRTLQSVSSGNKNSTSEEKALAEYILSQLTQVKRSQFQELDILEIEISSFKDKVATDIHDATDRDQVSVAMMDIDVVWTEGTTARPEKTSTLDAGYSRLFRNLCINGIDTPALRRKRELPEREREQGFHPSLIGYRETGDIINWANGPVEPRTDGVRILVRTNGMTAVRASDFHAIGFDPASIVLDQIRVWHRGVECPTFVWDNGDGVFGDSDAILFYGLASDSEFTADSVYTLTWFARETPPLRIADQTAEWKEEGFPAVAVRRVWDEESILVMKNPNNYGWYYAQLDQQVTSFPLELPGLADEGELSVSISLLNKTHKTISLAATIGSGTMEYTLTVNAATAVILTTTASEFIQSPTLVLTLSEPPQSISRLGGGMSEKVGDVPYVFIDSIDVVYPRAAGFPQEPLIVEKSLLPSVTAALVLNASAESFSFSAWGIRGSKGIARIAAAVEPASRAFALPDGEWDTIELYREGRIPGPRALEWDYLSTLHRQDQGANYVIIAYHTLLDSARKLAEWRTKEGFDVLLVDVQDIYDEFNAGYPNCDAIKRFLSYTQSEWSGLSPEFVVLVGESTWDHRDREKNWFADQVPTYAPTNDPQHYASDEWYAYLWGGVGDYYSDVIIGRISLQYPEEVDNYIKKVIRYETESPVGLWKSKNLYIADDSFERYGRDAAENSFVPQLFPEYIDQINFPHETNPYLYHRFVDDPDPEAKQYLNKKYSSDCQYAIIDAFNDGILIAQYIGHGGAQLWSDERIFYGMDKPTSNVLELKPNTRFPFVISWSCFVGYLNMNVPPFNVCLSEEFIRYADRGAIAMWAPSEKGDTSNHMIMSKLAMRNLCRDGLTRLGEITTFTKAEFMQSQSRASLVNQYILFGDPGANIPLPKEHLTVTCSPNAYLGKYTETFLIETTTANMDQGQAVVSFSVAGENIYESTPFIFSEGRIAHECAIAFDGIINGTAITRIYAWNDEKQSDAWGGVEIRHFQPEIALTGGTFRRDGNEGELSFDVVNRSVFDVRNVRCLLRIGDVEVELKADSLPANATETLQLKGQVPADTPIAYISLLEDPEQNIQATPLDDTLKIHLDAPADIPIVPLLHLIGFNSAGPVESQTMRFRLPFLNLSDSTIAFATVALEGLGCKEEIREVTLNPREERRLEFTVVPPQTGTIEYQVILANAENRREYSLLLDVLGKPDLALAEGEFSFSPERPVIGRTVYLQTTVFNVGDSPAYDVIVHAYDGDPSQNQRLEPFYRSGAKRIPRLDPGETKVVNIVWDPPAYTGLGVHDIHFVVDPNNRIDEISEQNNRVRMTLTLHDLPDLEVAPWSDHSLTLLSNRPIPIWGDPLQLWGRIRNVGDSEVRHARLSFLHNREEITHFFDRIPIGGGQETSFDVPLVSAKNTLTIWADKYDLIGEKGETLGYDNNISREKRLDLQLQMPEAPVRDQVRTYLVTSETHFSAGQAEFLQFDKKKNQLAMNPNLEMIEFRINPSYVKDEKSYAFFEPQRQWQWNTKYNSFYSPIQTDDVLRAEFPMPNGMYDVYVELFSAAYKIDQSEKINIKASQDSEYRLIEHSKPAEDEDKFHKIGTYSIMDDRFVIEFKAVPGGISSILEDIRFRRVKNNVPVAAGYLSPYFPAEGSGSGMVEMSWEADVPVNTDLIIKARWVQQSDSGELRFFPWARIVDGKEGKLNLSGKGKYFQYYALFTRNTHNAATPSLKNINITIPCH